MRKSRWVAVVWLGCCIMVWAGGCRHATKPQAPSTDDLLAIDSTEAALTSENQQDIDRWTQARAQLTEIYIDRWNITALPTIVYQCPQLERLTVSNTAITSLDPLIGDAKNLKELQLIHTRLTSLPDRLAELENLQELDLSETCVTAAMWEAIAKIPHLRVLRLNHCGLQLAEHASVPPQLESLIVSGGASPTGLMGDELETYQLLARIPTLRHFDFSAHSLRAVPEGLHLLHQVKSMDLSFNALAQLPENFAELQGLERLHLGLVSSQVEAVVQFPEVVFQLRALQSLEVSGNCEQVPDRFAELPRLKRLALHLRIESLPPGIAKLALTKLDLSHCLLTSLPEGIDKMKTLMVLNLGANQFPRGYIERYFKHASFPNLRYLGLRFYEMDELAQAFCNSAQLEFLDIKECGLKTEPKCLSQFKQLCHLDNQGNPYLEGPHQFDAMQCPEDAPDWLLD
jgi:Leucine-rich repeat (LRR) protein